MQYQVLIRAACRYALLVGALSWLAIPSQAEEQAAEQTSASEPSPGTVAGDEKPQKAKAESSGQQEHAGGAPPGEAEFQKAKHQED